MALTDDKLEELKALGDGGLPRTRKDLEYRLTEIAKHLNTTEKRARWLVGALVVSQMLPSNVLVKGSFGITLRVGDASSRATRDIDVVAQDAGELFHGINERLNAGLGIIPAKKKGRRDRIAFSGEVKPKEKWIPDGAIPEYVMQPYPVKLTYDSKSMCTIEVEVGHNEIDALESFDEVPLPRDLEAVLIAMGLSDLKPVRLLSAEQQIAQKIHALAFDHNDRAHDLIDLQVLWASGDIDLAKTLSFCRRTFHYRKNGDWPPISEFTHLTEGRYKAALEETDLFCEIKPDVIQAREWLEAIIDQISNA